MGDHENHPASALFPMMTDGEMSDLIEDIKQRGLLEPIVLCEGKVLDGRNRMAACKRNDIKLRFIKWNGEHGSPTQYVLAKNLHRRHLTISQRAMIAIEALPMLQEEAKKRNATSGPGFYGGKPPVVVPPQGVSPERVEKTPSKARDIAAKALGVGGSIVQKALAVKRTDPEESERIKHGETTVEQAYRKVTAGVPSKHQVQRENAQKDRMVEYLSRIAGAAKGLIARVDPAVLASTLPKKEIEYWRKDFLKGVRSVRQFFTKLENHKESNRVEQN